MPCISFQAFCIAMLKTCDLIKSIVNRAQVFEEVRWWFSDKLGFSLWENHHD